MPYWFNLCVHSHTYDQRLEVSKTMFQKLSIWIGARSSQAASFLVETEGFWQWCITLRITGILDLSVVRNSKYKKSHVSETQSLDQWLRLALSKGPNRVGASPSYLRTETFIFQKLCFLLFRIPDDGQSPEAQWFWVSFLSYNLWQNRFTFENILHVMYTPSNGHCLS
jgi:hypothetical protein